MNSLSGDQLPSAHGDFSKSLMSPTELDFIPVGTEGGGRPAVRLSRKQSRLCLRLPRGPCLLWHRRRQKPGGASDDTQTESLVVPTLDPRPPPPTPFLPRWSCASSVQMARRRCGRGGERGRVAAVGGVERGRWAQGTRECQEALPDAITTSSPPLMGTRTSRVARDGQKRMEFPRRRYSNHGAAA